MFSYDKIKDDIERLRQEGLIRPKTPVNYGWTKSMEGSGAPVPDAVVWKRRYEELAEENKSLRYDLSDALLLIHRLIKRIRTLGGTVQ